VGKENSSFVRGGILQIGGADNPTGGKRERATKRYLKSDLHKSTGVARRSELSRALSTYYPGVIMEVGRAWHCSPWRIWAG